MVLALELVEIRTILAVRELNEKSEKVKEVELLLGYCFTTLLGSYSPILTRDLLCLQDIF